MKTLDEMTITLESDGEERELHVQLNGVARDKKYQKEINKLLIKLSHRRYGEMLSGQPVHVDKRKGCYVVSTSDGRKLLGRM